ncbi:MAG TPA: hypothetical protein VKB88_05010 [Bryobacteraceae bacterium]|nr:hypothetical protein [Bryobacteraceae bacterium]
MTLRDLLVRAYPKSWRDEFGPELADILAHRELTPGVIADVLASSVRQHLRRDPWKICALVFAFWTAVVLIALLQGLVTFNEFMRCYFAGQLFLVAAGAWTILRKNSGIWKATTAAVKAALLPLAMCTGVLCLSIHRIALQDRFLHYWAPSSREIHWHTIYWKGVALLILETLVFCLAGASIGHLIGHFRRLGTR